MSESGKYGTMQDEPPAPAYAEHDPDEPAPPTYTDTQNEPPPPTYESLYGQIEEARRSAKSRPGFLKSVCTILFSTVGFIVFLGILLSVPIAMIVIGALNLQNCPLERYIPIWLIVGGSVGALMQLVSMFERIQKYRNPNRDDDQSQKYSNSCLGCFNIAWFIAGNVWVYRNTHPNTNPLIPPYCDYTTYYFSFWIITSVYILIGLACCCSCCVALCAGASKQQDDNA